MLLRQGHARGTDTDRHLAWGLAAVAGAVNIAGFNAVGLYSSNMTGNVSALADHLGAGDTAAAAVYGALVATFVTGAALSAVLVNTGRRRFGGIYALAILIEALLMAALGLAAAVWPGTAHDAALPFGLSFLMGLQNAVVTRISNARLRTTHVTGMLTDIGIELASLLDRSRTLAEAAANRAALRLHAETVAAFLAGGMAGVVAARRFGTPVLLEVAALVVLALAAHGIAAGRARPDQLAPKPPST